MPLKLGFQETKETQTRNMGTHHVLITPAKVRDLCLSSVSLLISLNKQSHSFSCMCLVQDQGIASLLPFSAARWLLRGAHCNVKIMG